MKRWPIPTLFIAGDHEAPYTRLIGDSLARWMPNARSITIAEGGHGVHLAQPERFNAAVLAFLTELERGR
ncbi:MAG: alpha/beta fold hydrolase [Gemmatimonadales bacterium]